MENIDLIETKKPKKKEFLYKKDKNTNYDNIEEKLFQETLELHSSKDDWKLVSVKHKNCGSSVVEMHI